MRSLNKEHIYDLTAASHSAHVRLDNKKTNKITHHIRYMLDFDRCVYQGKAKAIELNMIRMQ